MSFVGKALWADAAGTTPVIRDAPDWPVGENEVKIKVHAVALNPADIAILDTGAFVQSWPITLGYDASGEVVQVGKNVEKFSRGDRVATSFSGLFGAVGSKSAAFQEYAVTGEQHVFKIPDNWEYSDAAVFPIATATAAAGLFASDRLGLDLPKISKAAPNGKVVLVWGGSSSVGASAVQLASHAGYEVFATASRNNLELVKSLGATQVFDYRDANVIDSIVSALKDRSDDFVGAYSSAQDGQGAPPAVEVAARLGLDNSLVVTTGSLVAQEDLPAEISVGPIIFTQTFGGGVPGLPGHPEIGQAIFGQWLPDALAAGTIDKTFPAEIVGHGLEAIVVAFDKMRKKQNSGKKLVVTL